MIKQFFYFLLLFSTVQLQAQISGNDLFDDSYVHEIKLYFNEPDFWETMNTNYENGQFAGDYEYSESPTVYVDGNLINSVGVRQKGFSSYFASSYYKKSLKLDFDKFVEDQTYDGLKKINLNNGVGDPALMRDMLCYDIIRETGAPAPRTAHTRVYINDDYWGIYVIVEQMDKTFLAEHFDSNNGNLFKNIGWSALEWLGDDAEDYEENFELKTNKTENDWSGFIELLDIINNSSSSNFPEEIQRVFNVPDFLKVLAVDVMTDNWDSYIEHGRNYYLYQEPNDGKFNWLPWDYNLALGGNFSAFGSPQVLDTICPMFPEFSFMISDTSDLTVDFTDLSTVIPESWSWDFGDGNTSTEQSPTHDFTTEDIYNICLTITNTYPDGECSKTYCDQVDLTIDYSDCPSLINGSCPYEPNDPILHEVMLVADYCCDTWGGDCQDIYNFFYDDDPGGPGGGFSIDFPLILNNPEKRLVDRLMDVDEFRELYLSYACDILENNFTAERLYTMIDTQAALIKDAVYADPNYLFSNNYFDYDVGYGGQANGAVIPQLKIILEERIDEIQSDLDDTNYDCTPAISPIATMDIVINEVVASNDSTSSITDANGDFDDWIELYNNTDNEIDLAGFYLSDNNTLPYKWAFPIGTTIEGGGYLIVWADNQEAQEGLHADFQLAKDGEELLLSHSDGTIIDQVTFGEQTTNLGYARNPNGTGDFVIQGSTFAENNEGVVSINTITKKSFKVYPNPAKDIIHVSLPELNNSENLEIGIYNSLGQLVIPFRSLINPKNTFTINTDGISGGLYQVLLRSEEGIIGVESVVVQ
ncbi:MAG: CotH kinase family protein [Saprospiraceae bacterium]